MAYLGNAPVVGDSSNTFKLLDDIASFTVTFDGSSADVVSVANDTLTFTNHRFVTGQRVTYGKGGGTVITGLTDGTAYFIIKVDQSTIKLATNASNAASSTAIDLTGLGAGTSHTLNVAFDGVNTKFKATHSNGTKASVSRAAQLSLSINGVIQQPTEAKPPTVGYGIEADSTIVFSTAPSVADKVFGSFIGEVAPSFDLTDNTVNNFTGDGSTSTFNLSKEIPSNNDVLVTLDGVTQHPSDGSTTRAYSVVGSSLIFVSAPADGVAIQARLIGFAGATTSEVTGFYGRTGNVALKSTDDIAFQNASAGIITASKFVGELVGVVTATDVFVSGIATFSGDVGIAGTLTYEDVTNIDSVGIITARSNILVGSGITLSPDGDIFATGISTFSEGFAGDVLIDDKIVHRGDTDTAIRFTAINGGDTISFETGGDERVRIDSAGRLLVGTNTARQTRAGNGSYQPEIQLEGTGASMAMGKFGDNANPARLVLQKARGTQSSPTIVQDNDEVGSLTFSGWDGDTFTNSAQIRSEVDGTPGDDDMPGNLIFYTTSDGASTTTERLRITSTGNIYTSGDQVRDDAKLTISTDDVGISTAINIHNSSGNGAKISSNKSIVLSADFENNSGVTGSYISFETNSTEKVVINSGGQLEVKEGELKLTKQGGSNLIRLGVDQNASNYAYIDLIGDTNYTSYGLRLIRNNGGENTDSLLIHRGTGVLTLQATEAGKISFKTQDQERLRISSGGVILKGHSSVSSDIHDPQTTTSRTPGIQIHGSNSVSASAALIAWNSNTSAYYSNALYLAHSGSDTIGTNGAVSNSTTLGSIVFSGDDGDEFVKGAIIQSEVDGTVANNDMPANLIFYTNSGDSTPDERMRIRGNGSVCIGEPGAFTPGTGADELVIGNANNGVNRGMTIYNHSGSDGRINFAQPDDTDAGAIKYSHGSDIMQFFVEGDERLRINAAGDLQVRRDGNGDVFRYYRAGASLFVIDNLSTDSNTRMRIRNPASGGSISYNSAASDITLKKNFESWDENVLDLFKNINPQKFNFKQEEDGTEKTKGFIAQEMVGSFPEAYSKGDEENAVYYFNPSGMVVYLMKALQEAQIRIETLENKVSALEG